MKKKLNTDDITNELKGSSLFFQRETPVPQSPDEPSEAENLRKRGNTEINIEGTERGTAPSAEPLVFDLNQTPDCKYTLAFTEAELEALDDLKVNLRKIHGLKAPKIDIIRLALHHLLADYQAQGETSIVVAGMKSRKTGKE
jgi:hypothetical protein